MARPPVITRDSIAPLIRVRGPVSTTELAAALRVNRTTIARTLPDFGDELVTLGATRSTRYLLRRTVRNIGDRWPMYRIDTEGRACGFGELEALHDRAWRVNWAGEPPEWAGHFLEPNGLWSGFPFFLGDIRPQGFIGRIVAARISRLLFLPDDLRHWADDETLAYLQAAGENLPGNLLLGEESLRRTLSGMADSQGAMITDRATAYPRLAAEIFQQLPASSAGGEQPKFLALLPEGHRLVKFTAPMEQETARRWADLLVCEWHAHEVLAQAGLANPGARLMDAGGRRFLEVPRFDRAGASGRIGTVSLEALSAASTGLARDWNAAALDLENTGLITAATRTTIARLHAFGELIGNSDMHAGNLSFFLGDTLPLEITPAYDMLPMLWAPGSQGELVPRRFAPAPPVPARADAWREAAELSERFWQRAAADPRLTPAFATIAAQSAETLTRLRAHVGS